MVRVGPWTVEEVRYGEWRKCDRCGAAHKEVWVCTVDANAEKVIQRLDGKATWKIGSTCGPTLMLVSDIEWKDGTKDIRRKVSLAVDTTWVLDELQRRGGVDEYGRETNTRRRLALLLDSKLERREQKALRFFVSRLEAELKHVDDPDPPPSSRVAPEGV